MDASVQKIVNKRTGLGAGIGALVGFFFAGPLGAAAGAAAGGALANMSPSSSKGAMTPKREAAYAAAMASMDAQYIRGVADAFASEGLAARATMLRNRADLRSLPAHVQEKRKSIFRDMMACDDPDEIDRMAIVFENESSAGSAMALRDHAVAVKAARDAGVKAKPIEDDKMLEGFADKLAKALLHYGPHTKQTRSAAANFVRARGLDATEANVVETITACAAELGVSMTAAPEAQGQPAANTAAAPDDASATAAPDVAEEAAPDSTPASSPSNASGAQAPDASVE